MAADVVMPQMGESIFEGTITKWLKKPGDKVERDEPLFEISTDKVDAEIPSPSAGVLKEIKVKEGQTVPINTVVASIDAAGSAAAAPAQPSAPAPAPAPKAETPKPTAAPAPQPAASKPGPVPVPSPQAPAPPAAAAASAPAKEGARIHSSPLVRRMAKEHGIDLSTVPGTGAGGRISKQDMEAAIAGGGGVPSPFEPAEEPAYSAPTPPPQAARPAVVPPPPPAYAPAAASPAGHGTQYIPSLQTGVPRERLYFGNYEVEPLSTMRLKIAEHMVASKHVSPHVYSVDEIDMSKVAALRAKSKDEFEKQYGTKLTFMPFFVKAVVAGLRAFPTLNASLDGTNVVLHKEINVGIAVALDWGLIVPVIKNADEKNILGIQRTMSDLAERARSKKLRPEEVQEGTFSITNPGVFGGLFGLPVISQPNVGILGLGAIEKRPVVINDSIAIRSMCYVTLSYDHRVVDGAVAHQFLHKVKETLETWSSPLV
ncbi:MAG TPA: dihydrolipoamide acetyltransferase family protein [Candidatus Eisenbacteria bacterium]|jgi:2-oxoglutarate dehydrogenase E2 component (dihydrolipoamide succinyltransferase)|nr:dihydrolipoamide acetyltransferase family protein [Candidatus Eisenbacteria bacterium]